MKRSITYLVIFTLLVSLTGCSIRKAANMANCSFAFKEVTGVTWAGIDFVKIGLDYKKLDASTLVSCASALARKDFALHVNIDLDAVNQTKNSAGMAGFDYIIYYKGNKVGEGESLNERDIEIPAKGGKTTIPVNFTLNCKDILNIKQPLKSAENVVGLISDIAKIGKEETDICVKIRPHVRLANKVIKGTYLKVGGGKGE